MGTRNLTCVVLDGEYRVAQYGQWDGYPSGQGSTVLTFLRTADLSKFREQIRKTKALTANEANAILRSDDKTCPVSRDMGAGILAHIQKAADPAVFLQLDFAADSLMCEWAYVVDLDKNTLEVYRGFNKTRLSRTERFYFLRDKAEGAYHPIRLCAQFKLDDLSPSAMSDLEARESEEEG